MSVFSEKKSSQPSQPSSQPESPLFTFVSEQADDGDVLFEDKTALLSGDLDPQEIADAHALQQAMQDELKGDMPLVRIAKAFDPNRFKEETIVVLPPKPLVNELSTTELVPVVRYTSDAGQSLAFAGDGCVVDINTGYPADGWSTKISTGERYHFKMGAIHHDDEPACKLPNNRGNIWYHWGKIHKEDGPAMQITTSFGAKRTAYFKNGLLHNERGPSDISIEEDGLTITQYHIDGVLTRDGAPAYTEMRDGKITRESWYRSGLLHREDGPAYTSGHVMEFRQEGELHNINGMAVVHKNAQGEEIGQYFLQGIEVDQKQQRAAFLNNRGAKIGRSIKDKKLSGLSDEGKKDEMTSRIDSWLETQQVPAKDVATEPQKKRGMTPRM